MNRRISLWLTMLCAALLLSGCSMSTVNDMYCLPKRSQTDSNLQSAIDSAMANLDYSAPIAGENQQTVQMADLNGDGKDEYILFARNSTDKSMQILVFAQHEEKFDLSATIESHGSAFEQVEYVNIDDQPGLEMVVGRQVSEQVLRSVSVYSFAGGSPKQLMTANYLKFLTCDLDQNSHAELMLIQPGQSDADRGTAVLYSFQDGEMLRSQEVEMSASADSVKRIMVSRLHGDQPAVYVASAVADSAIITDVFAIRYGRFANISFSNESGTSVQTLRNYYVFADDVDSDGVLELPDLITMQPIKNSTSAEKQYLIRWYAMNIRGKELTKVYTFHNYLGGWYLELDGAWAERVSVIQTDGTYWFYIWDEAYEKAELLFSIHVLNGADREETANSDNRFVLYRAEGVTYAARLESGAKAYDISQENLIPSFHLIYQAWKTGET